MYKDKHIGVLGLGIAGVQTAKKLMQMGAVVVAWDDMPDACKNAEQQGIKITDLLNFDITMLDFLVVSPGVPDTHPICANAKHANIPLIGEVKIRYDLCPHARYVGITGTNGKSTTTALIAHILHCANIPYAVGGNFGTAAIALPDLGADGVYVLEMSSYMLTRIKGVKFSVAGFLNMTADHLAWHGTMDKYFIAKMHIFDDMTDGAVVCTDDIWGKQVFDILSKRGCAVRTVSYQDTPETPYLKGNHNRQNIAIAMGICAALGIDKNAILQACRSFKGLKHRQQTVYENGTVSFINDSKATNVQSALMALGGYKNIHWIAGGQEKDSGYDDLIPVLDNITHAYLIGEGANHIGEFLHTHDIPFTISKDLKTAVDIAGASVKDMGGVVVLSPACASWDQFNSFAHRGDMFIQCVQNITADWNI